MKNPETSWGLRFTHPRILGRAGITGGSRHPPAPTPRGLGERGGSIPSKPGVVLCPDPRRGGYNARPPPQFPVGFGPG